MMKEMKHFCISNCLLLFFCALISTQCIGQVWLLPIYLEEKGYETKLEFYGILKDQDGKPVSGAKVNYTLSYVGIVKPVYSKKHSQTGSDGKFELHGGKIAKLYIDSFELEGYAYEGTTKCFEFQKIETKCHNADKANPVEFRIRRKIQEAVPLKRVGFSLIIGIDGSRKHGNWAGYDINGYGEVSLEQLERQNSNDYLPKSDRVTVDFELSGKYDAEHNTWTVAIKANGGNAGLQFSEAALYEAPMDGYVKEMTMTYPVMDRDEARKKFPKYIYARVREPGFYMRAKIGQVLIDENRFVVQAAGVLNPFGNRCLEMLEITDYDEKARFDKAADKALCNQQFAEQPDFKQLIKEGKAKY